MLKNAVIFFVLVLLLTSVAWADQTEEEPNSSAYNANGPINFDEMLTGGLPGSYGSDGSGILDDFWSFDAVKGATYTFSAMPRNVSGLFPMDIGLELDDSQGAVVIVDAKGDNQGETLRWTCTADGTYYLDIYEATGQDNTAGHYEVTCTQVKPVDTQVPGAEAGGSYKGITSAARLIPRSQALIEWNQAKDNTTSAANMKYNVYYSTSQGNVFTGGQKQTFTGVTEGMVTGLTPGSTYYFGVRAQDEANNEDTNTKTLSAAPYMAVSPGAWMMYE